MFQSLWFKEQRKIHLFMNFSITLFSITSFTVTDSQAIIACTHYFKIIFWKKNSLKMEVLRIFGSWHQEIDSWFTNHEPLVSTLNYSETFREILWKANMTENFINTTLQPYSIRSPSQMFPPDFSEIFDRSYPLDRCLWQLLLILSIARKLVKWKLFNICLILFRQCKWC